MHLECSPNSPLSLSPLYGIYIHRSRIMIILRRIDVSGRRKGNSRQGDRVNGCSGWSTIICDALAMRILISTSGVGVLWSKRWHTISSAAHELPDSTHEYYQSKRERHCRRIMTQNDRTKPESEKSLTAYDYGDSNHCPLWHIGVQIGRLLPLLHGRVGL
jgi:hypothetical protein